MTGNDVFKWIDAFAPFETQDEYDNAGMLAGNPSAAVHSVLFSLDVTRPVVREAARIGAELIVSHHPLMFRPIQQIRYDRGEGAVLKALVSGGIGLIAAHTNLDRCTGGVADSLAETLSLEEITASDDCPYLRKGTLSAPCTAREFLSVVNRRLSAPARLYGNPDTVIHSAAVIPGAGGEDYAYTDADVLITGEIKHHELLGAMDQGLIVIDAGHYPTEFPGIAALYTRFCRDTAANNWGVEAQLYTQPPFSWLT